MSDDVLLTTDHGGVRVLSMNRPDKLNALNTELTTALRDALQAADRDDGVRAVVLTGNGRAFCAGADLREFTDLTPEQEQRVLDRAALTADVQSLPQRVSVPVVAAAAGPVRGGGAGLALACDMLIVADDVTLGYPEVTHSIVPALVMTGLERHFPRKVAFELVVSGRLLSAPELLGFGVANRVVAAGQQLEAALELAQQLAELPTRAVQTSKELLYRVADLPTDAAIRAGQDVNALMRSFRS